MFRNIRLFGFMFGYMLLHLPILRKGLKAVDSGDYETADAIAMKHVPVWSDRLVKISGCSIRLSGQENIPADRPVVFAANHRSMYDVLILLTRLGKPIPIVSKIEVTKIPLIRSWMKLLHCLFLDRDNPKQGMQVILNAVKLVEQGYNVGIFPEGTRYKGEEGGLGTFLSGAFRIASKSGAPVVPVVIFGSRAALEGSKGIGIAPADIEVRILPPVETQGLSRAEQKELPKQVEDIVRAELAKGPTPKEA